VSTTTRRLYERRTCFYGLHELLVRINVDTTGFQREWREAHLGMEKVMRPARPRRRLADSMVGNGHLWKNR